MIAIVGADENQFPNYLCMNSGDRSKPIEAYHSDHSHPMFSLFLCICIYIYIHMYVYYIWWGWASIWLYLAAIFHVKLWKARDSVGWSGQLFHEVRVVSNIQFDDYDLDLLQVRDGTIHSDHSEIHVWLVCWFPRLIEIDDVTTINHRWYRWYIGVVDHVDSHPVVADGVLKDVLFPQKAKG